MTLIKLSLLENYHLVKVINVFSEKLTAVGQGTIKSEESTYLSCIIGEVSPKADTKPAKNVKINQVTALEEKFDRAAVSRNQKAAF